MTNSPARKRSCRQNVDPFVDQIIAKILKRVPVTESIESTVGRA